MSPAHIIPTSVASDDLTNDQIDFLMKMNVIAVVVIIISERENPRPLGVG
jgi:hypothetical protein